jgi:hemoglobin
METTNTVTTTILILLALAVIYIVYNYFSKPSQTIQHFESAAEQQTLYDRLGGVFSIAAVVNNFSDALIINPVVGIDSKNQYLREWNRNRSATRLPGLKFMRTLWLCNVAGGPYTYVPTNMGKCPLSLENAHKNLQISPEEFKAVADELKNSLNHFNVPEKEQTEVMNAFGAHMNEIIYGYNVANKIQSPSIKC